jgi:hypothetical protein
VFAQETFDAPGPLPPAPKGLAAAPASCRAFTNHTKNGKSICDGKKKLADALAETSDATRDLRLAEAELCSDLPPGLVRAVRAELAPTECGDAVVGALPKDARGEVAHALAGLAVAGRLARAVGKAPRLAPPFDKDRVLAFIRGPLKDWMLAQAALTQELSSHASRLAGYGKAVAAVEAGLADLRLVEAMRAVPIPDTFAKDPELKQVYEASLDQMLEPRKDRGRDAALVGLKQLAVVGVIADPRVARARKLLGQMYAGRRIDALDALMLPSAAAPGQGLDVDHRLAASLPTAYAGALLDPKVLVDRDGVAALAPRGLPLAARVHAKSDAPPEARLDMARARLGLARLYWRAVDVDEAAAAAKSAGGGGGSSPEADFFLALALALRGGPEDAAKMILTPPPEGLGLGDVRALDAIVGQKGKYAGIAAFDAAWITRVAAPRSPNPALWKNVAERFRAAAELLADLDAKARAESAAREAEAIAHEK